MSDAATGAGGGSVRLTGRGFGLLVTAAVAAALAVVLGYRELTLLAAAGASALAAGALAVARRIPLAVEVGLDHRQVQRGDPARLTLTVANTAARRSPPVAVTVGGPTSKSKSKSKSGSGSGSGPGSGSGSAGCFGVPGLAASASLSFDVALDTSSRGMVAVGPVAMRRIDRFGLLARFAHVGEVDHLHVWPRPRVVMPLASPRSRDAGGQAIDGAPGGVMFNSLREYVLGDDLRRVHWPSSARRGELLVRENTEPSEPTSTVLLDTRPVGYPPGPAGDIGFDEAVDVAASVVLASTRLRSPVRLVTTSGVSVVGRRRRSDEATFLDALAVVARDDAATFDVVATSRRGGVGTLTVVTGIVDAGQLEAVAPVVHRFEQVVVVRVGVGPPQPSSHSSSSHLSSSRPSSSLSRRERGLGTGRLRLLDVRTAAELPNLWPSRSTLAALVPPPRFTGP